MLPYFILIGVPIVFALLQHRAKTWEEYQKKQRNILILFFLIYAILLCLRHKSVGIDLANYEFLFRKYDDAPWQTIFRIPISQEPGYAFLCRLIGSFTDNFQIMIALTSLLIVLPIAILYIRESENGLMTIAIFLNISLFVMFFSGIRQSIAISLMMPLYYATKKKKLLLYFLLIFVGYLFHNSVLVALPFYFVYHVRINKNWLLIIVPVLLLCYVFNQQLFSLSMGILGERYVERYGEIKTTDAYAMLILFAIFAVYSFVIPDQWRMDPDTIGLRNILLFSVIIQSFAPLNEVAMRMNYYYLVFTPLVMPKLANRTSDHYRSIATVSRVVINVFFFAYFIYFGYRGEDILQVFPYIPFWSVW